MASPELEVKLARLREIVAGLGRTLVAFSGGVDSTFLAKVCHDVLGKNAVAITALSPSYPAAELEEAKALAQLIGIEHRIIETREVEKEDYARNNPDRCYHCKRELFTELEVIREAEGFASIVYGAIADDLGDYRPGMEAAKEMQARAPLVEAGLHKSEIRELSSEMGLPTWDKPGGACLSSRIPYGSRVTVEKLQQIDRAEQFLRTVGFRQVRVRHHGEIARIEVAPEEMPRFFENNLNAKVAAALKAIGFKYVALDLQGYRSGSLNEGLANRTVIPLHPVAQR